MLPATVRMRRREEFAAAQRRGRRIGQRTLVVHARVPHEAGAASGVDVRSATSRPGASGSTGTVDTNLRVGFVVGRAVGNSVIRHRVQRQLRHIVRDRLDALPNDARLVIRALPAAAGQPSGRLAADFDAAVERLGSARTTSGLKSGSRPPR